MTAGRELLSRVLDTYEGYFALGNECLEWPGVRIVRNHAEPSVYDANHASFVRARSPAALERVLARFEEAFAGLDHRCVHTNPLSHPVLEARLALAGHLETPTLQMLLEGELRARPSAVELRLPASDADWEAVVCLTRLDHEEVARRFGRPPYPEALARSMTRVRRAKEPQLRFWLARAEGVDCGFLSSWPGVGGIGMVEDLFVHPDLRRRGVATTLLAHAVADARARGASAVLIGARPDNSPKDWYAALGFRPLCVTRSWVRSVAGS
jgi:ribosomal protein S18 acetylase RimI-like enzyme